MADAVGVGRDRLWLLDGGCIPCATDGIDGAEDMGDQAGDIAPAAAAPRWLVLLGIGQVPLVEGW